MGVVMLIKKSFSRAGYVCAGLGLLKERGRAVYAYLVWVSSGILPLLQRYLQH